MTGPRDGRAAVRVLLVLGSSTGGVGRHVCMLARGLVRRGHRVAVAGPRATEEAFGFTEAGARFAEVPIADRPRPASDARSVARLRALARGADVVHAHGLRAGALAALALTGMPGRPRLLVTLHNAVTAGGAIGAIYRLLERIVARRADHVLVVSPDLGERMRARRARRVGPAIVPAPPLGEPTRSAAEVRQRITDLLGARGAVPGDGAAPGSAAEPERSAPPEPAGPETGGAAAGGPAPRPVLLTVARLAQQKGLETLLDTAAGPYPEDPVFVIAGEGPLRDALRARIEADGLPVVLYGWADPADLLQVAHAVIVPSRWEGQPLVVQEALRAGKPIIATRVGGIPDMVGEAAILVPPGDPAALRREIGRLLGDPALAARLAAAAAARGAALPGEDEAVESVLACYRAQRGR